MTCKHSSFWNLAMQKSQNQTNIKRSQKFSPVSSSRARGLFFLADLSPRALRFKSTLGGTVKPKAFPIPVDSLVIKWGIKMTEKKTSRLFLIVSQKKRVPKYLIKWSQLFLRITKWFFQHVDIRTTMKYNLLHHWNGEYLFQHFSNDSSLTVTTFTFSNGI